MEILYKIMTVIKMLYLQFYILLRAHVDSADAVLYCVELFSLMLVLLLYERAPALFESHFITFIVLSFFFFHFFSLFIDVSSVIIVFNVNYVNHSPLYPYNIIQSTLDVSNTVVQSRFYLKEISVDTFSDFVCFANLLASNR